MLLKREYWLNPLGVRIQVWPLPALPVQERMHYNRRKELEDAECKIIVSGS